jgi:hypothetical protein
MVGPFEGKRLLHFKGPRKKHMSHYARFLLPLADACHG